MAEKLVDHTFIQQHISRRKLGTALAAIGSGLIYPSCTTSPRCVPEGHRTCLARELTPTVTKAEIRQLLQELPETPYKGFAFRYALPLLADRPPGGIDLSGIWVKINDFRVTTDDNGNMIGGSINPGKFDKTPSVTLESQRFIASLPFLMKGRNLNFAINFDPDAKFRAGLEPELSFNYPGNLVIKTSQEAARYHNLRKFILVKEAFTLGWIIAYLEAMVTQMRTEGLPFSVKYQGQNLEAVSYAFIFAGTYKGKLVATADIGGFILQAKALQQNKSLIELIRLQPVYASIIDAVSQRDFGTRAEDMLPGVIDFIDSNKQLFGAPKWYQGDLDKLP